MWKQTEGVSEQDPKKDICIEESVYKQQEQFLNLYVHQTFQRVEIKGYEIRGT
jgi:hypothetical protein